VDVYLVDSRMDSTGSHPLSSEQLYSLRHPHAGRMRRGIIPLLRPITFYRHKLHKLYSNHMDVCH
jgi:hypothetical protein